MVQWSHSLFPLGTADVGAAVFRVPIPIANVLSHASPYRGVMVPIEASLTL